MYYLKKATLALKPRKFKVGEFGKVLVRFASSQLLSNFLRMVAGFVVVRMVEPSTYGQFAGVGVFLGYILLGHGGILNGISRELPYELGRGNKEYAVQLANSANFITFVIGIIASTLFLGFGIYHLFTGDTVTGTIFISYALPAFLYLYNKQYLPSLYRTNKDFDSLSRQNILTGIGNVLSVIFVYQWGLWGLCIRQIFIFVYETWLLHKKKPYRITLQYQKDDLKKLLGTGFPIFVAGNINPLVTTVMNNVLFSLGGALNYGYYALTNIVSSAIGIIPNSFSQVIYPRMSIMYGEGKSVQHILKVNVKPLIFQFFVLFGMGLVGAILLPWLVPIFLPKYSPGIAAAQWMMFVPATQAFGSMLNIFSVMKKMKPYIIANITGGLISIAYAVIMTSSFGFNLVYFPQALMIGKLFQQAISFIQLYYILKNGQDDRENS
jgi:O-antigen/teichoic acid export membrane protein